MNEIAKKESSAPKAQPVARTGFLSKLAQRFLQKWDRDEITVKHIIWILGLSRAELDEYVANRKKFSPEIVVMDETELSEQKFVEFENLGIVTIPYIYQHSGCLDSFRKRNAEHFKSIESRLRDKNYHEAVTALEPGRKFRVKVYRQAVKGAISSEERIKFLAAKGALLAGPQGLSLVWEQKRQMFQPGFAYLCFDEKRELSWMSVDLQGKFTFQLTVGDSWLDSDLFLSFEPLENFEEESII